MSNKYTPPEDDLSERLKQVLDQLETVCSEMSVIMDEFLLGEKIKKGEIDPKALKDFMMQDDDEEDKD